MRILLIEDDEADAELQTLALRAAKFDVSASQSGRAGIEAALEEKPDVIVCDVNMIHHNGYWVAESCKSSLVLRHIPLIALTGEHGMFASERKAMAAGFDALLLKPLDVAAFVALVKKLCAPYS
jgi:CheY-like chemotaxis protein